MIPALSYEKSNELYDATFSVSRALTPVLLCRCGAVDLFHLHL